MAVGKRFASFLAGQDLTDSQGEAPAAAGHHPAALRDSGLYRGEAGHRRLALEFIPFFLAGRAVGDRLGGRLRRVETVAFGPIDGALALENAAFAVGLGLNQPLPVGIPYGVRHKAKEELGPRRVGGRCQKRLSRNKVRRRQRVQPRILVRFDGAKVP